MRWYLNGTEPENALVQEALDRCDFPFEDYGDAVVPVEWADLSRYGRNASAEVALRHHDTHEGEYDTLEYREQVLGLAWYSGKITLEQDLVDHPSLAMEVFLSEGAHMVDFENIGGMTDEERRRIWNAVHSPDQHLSPGTDISNGVDLGHGHGWFDVSTYRSWVGEAWMGLFTKAFSDIPVTIPFDHPPTDAAVAEVRQVFLPEPEAPEPASYFGITGSTVYHDTHGGIRRDVRFATEEQAQAAGRRPCKVCKP